MGTKPVLLLNWHYMRQDVTEPLLILAREFELVFLYNYSYTENKGITAPYQCIFWNDYKSPYELLAAVKPAKILFGDIESFHQLSLNLAARTAGIPTYLLEHGLRGDYEIDIDRDRYLHPAQNAIENKVHIPVPEGNHTLQFYLRALKLKNIHYIFKWMLFIYFRKKYGITYGLYKCQGEFRRASWYINFTERNASYITKRDGVPLSRFRLIGIPAFDVLFKRIAELNSVSTENYILLFDAPFTETPIFSMDLKRKNKFLSLLNDFALRRKCSLYIKLHPQSYTTAGLYEHENIRYFQHSDIAELIMKSEGCVHVHLSTLTPVALLYKPYLFFNTYSEYNTPLKPIGLTENSFDDFDPETLDFQQLNAGMRDKVIEQFLFSLEGNAQDKLLDVMKEGRL